MPRIERQDMVDEKFDHLYDALQRERDATIILLKAFDSKVRQFDSKKSLPRKDPIINSVVSPAKSVKVHDCGVSPQCRPEWNMLGCIKLYHMKAVDERLAFLKSKKTCVKCGSRWSKNHKCQWNGKKGFAKCVAINCKNGAIVCKAHGSSSNVSSNLKGWLVKNNVKLEEIFTKPFDDKKVRYCA